ncbi:pantetheine-phosphate adenylyltransferase [Chitinivorax sp. PXF-14]|uniref:pantetheine-phosphate adenylyltransferase n=1 Tax=Chitinivorax sp. PXF-14 TaxID=3230488 RepID=UPI003466D582
MKRAVYAGSFDPVTKGHLWMIEQGVKLFDELVVAIGLNPEKRYTFSVGERKVMLKECTRHLPHLRVEAFENQFLVNYAKSIGANYILRGIRSTSDYEFERTMRYINGDLFPDIDTLFLMPPREIAEVSSTMVKGLVGPDGWQQVVKQYVPEAVYQHLLDNAAQGS